MHEKEILPFYCFYCGNTFKNENVFLDHVTNGHFEEKPLRGECYICSEYTCHIVKHVILKHNLTHCEICFCKFTIEKKCNCFLNGDSTKILRLRRKFRLELKESLENSDSYLDENGLRQLYNIYSDCDEESDIEVDTTFENLPPLEPYQRNALEESQRNQSRTS